MFYSFFFFKQKTAYEMRISDWSSDVCSSDLYLFSLGVDGILPRGIGIPHPRLKSPHRPSLLVSGFTTLSVLGVAICGVPPEALYVQLVGIAGYSFIALFVLAAIVIATYLVRTQRTESTRVGEACVRTCCTRWSQ